MSSNVHICTILGKLDLIIFYRVYGNVAVTMETVLIIHVFETSSDLHCLLYWCLRRQRLLASRLVTVVTSIAKMQQKKGQLKKR